MYMLELIALVGVVLVVVDGILIRFELFIEMMGVIDIISPSGPICFKHGNYDSTWAILPTIP